MRILSLNRAHSILETCVLWLREDRMSASKKAVNLSIDVALLREARERDINLSATLERALADALRQQRRERWLAENRPGIAAYNEQVDAHGAFADTLRTF
jgi:antitoxin CcdA